jgi:hypothetical protein
VRATRTARATGAGLRATTVDDVFATTARNALAKLGRLLWQHLKTGFASVDTIVEVLCLRRTANAHALAELQALFVLAVAVVVVVVTESVRTMSALLAVFDTAPTDGHRDRNSQQASQHDRS